MTVAARRPQLRGISEPRIAPPAPLHHQAKAFKAAARHAGLTLYPWQETASRYLMARDGLFWRYREVCIVVARQNGKTTLLVPRILWGLSQGRRMVHTAQNRSIPREAFIAVTRLVDPATLIRPPRLANGQEKIETTNGGSYKIIAPQKGVRGLSADDLFVDELREFTDWDFVGAADPILMASADPQTIYLSNAGDADSVVLNDYRAMESDEMAYLEWSADPDLMPDDPLGWEQSNPSLGHNPAMERNLRYAYAHKPEENFETENLCRWVGSMAAKLVRPGDWEACRADQLDDPVRPALGIAVDPDGHRASAVMAWQQHDGTYAVDPILERQSDAVLDVDELGATLRTEAIRRRCRQVAFSGVTDVALSRYLPKAQALDGRLYANASATFAQLAAGRQLRWIDGDGIGQDLLNIVRKPNADAIVAVRHGDRPVTAGLAAIRAVWLASAPRTVPRIG